MNRIERISVTTAMEIPFPNGVPRVSVVLSPALFGSQLGAFLRTKSKLTSTDRVRVVSIELFSTNFPDYQLTRIPTQWRSLPLWTLMTRIPFHLNPDGAPAILSQDDVALLEDAYTTFFIQNRVRRDQEFARTITVEHGPDGSGIFKVAIRGNPPTLSGIGSGGHILSREWNPTLGEVDAQLETGEGLAVYGIVRIQNRDPATNRIRVTVRMDLELTNASLENPFAECVGGMRRHRKELAAEILNEAPDFSEGSEEGSSESASEAWSGEDRRARDRSRSRSRRRESSASRSPMRRTRKSEFLASERRQSPNP